MTPDHTAAIERGIRILTPGPTIMETLPKTLKYPFIISFQ